MKQDSALTRMTWGQEISHEEDRKNNPENHWLTKDSYLRVEMQDMCLRCADHYEWNKQLIYNACEDKYYKIKPRTTEQIKDSHEPHNTSTR